MGFHRMKLDRTVVRNLLECVLRERQDGEYIEKLCLVVEEHVGYRLNQNLAIPPIHHTVLHIHFTRFREVNDRMSVETSHDIFQEVA